MSSIPVEPKSGAIFGRDRASQGSTPSEATLLNEKGYRSEVIEKHLAPAERNQMRVAYNYAQYMPKRTRMMQGYADYFDELRATICPLLNTDDLRLGESFFLSSASEELYKLSSDIFIK